MVLAYNEQGRFIGIAYPDEMGVDYSGSPAAAVRARHKELLALLNAYGIEDTALHVVLDGVARRGCFSDVTDLDLLASACRVVNGESYTEEEEEETR